MLRSTFLHLPGVAERTERVIWRAGVGTWMEFVSAREIPGFSPNRVAGLRAAVVESIQHYEAGHWTYFDDALPGRHKWRAYGEFAQQALFVDIETDGGIGPNAITVIGVYDGRGTQLFVRGRDLHKAAEVIAAHPVVVTFNGASFDMPLIRAHFPRARFNHIHIDLLHPLRRLGHGGGLKAVETQLGLARSGDTAGLDGWDAVRLWREYQGGSREALDLLLRYNEEDIRHLKPLADLVYRQLSERLMA